MPFYLLYIIKVSVCLALVFLFYRVVLRKLTFYTWNRFYLSGYILFSFLVPFVNITPVLEEKQWGQSQIVDWVPVIGQSSTEVIQNSAPASSDPWFAIMLLLLAGMLILVIRLMIQFLSFYRMKKKAIPIYENGIKVYQVDDDIVPFSFGNAIYLNRHRHEETALKEIIRHEFVHVKQRHSLDILLAELLCLFNWFNPFAWMLRKAIRQNLEFIADHKVLQHGVDRKTYQFLLLKVTGNYQYSIATQFNFSSLKKRIAMMNKIRSHRMNLLRFLFILPLAAVILLSFRKQRDERLGVNAAVSQLSGTDTVPRVKEVPLVAPVPPPPPVPVTLPDHIRKIDRKDNQVTVTLKNGKQETYNLQVPSEKRAFEKKYGELLPPPPPPPAPATAIYHKMKDVRYYEITDSKASIELMDGTKKEFDLTTREGRQAFEEKYDKVIAVAVAVPLVVTTTANVAVSNPSIKVAPATTTSLKIIPDGVATTIINKVTLSPSADVAVAAYSTNADYEPRITGRENIVITISKKTTRQELETFKKKMREKGVDLDFGEVVYNDAGIITHIKGTMKSNDSSSNFSVTDFETLTLAMIKEGNKTWFKVLTNKEKEVI